MAFKRIVLLVGAVCRVTADTALSSSYTSLTSIHGFPIPAHVGTYTFTETLSLECPSPSTVWANVTQYVPVTTTETQPITIYQTVISTNIETTTKYTTQTIPVTATVTSVATSPLTLTASEELLVYTTTSQLTSLTICPSRTVNPTFTAQLPLPTDWTWGCPPGWLCKPQQLGCNFEAGLPDRNFYCAPNECIRAETLSLPLQTWDATVFGNSTPLVDPSLTVNAIDSYFNMAPLDFGLTYDIFVVKEVFTFTSTIIHQPTATVAARQAQTSVPGACYPWCNNCLLEAQSSGKNSALCMPGSAFEVSLQQCEQCISVHKSDSSGSFVQIAPQFQQYLDYCAQYTTVMVSTSATVTSTNSAQSTFTTVVATTSATVIPIGSGSSIPSATTSVASQISTASPAPSSSVSTPSSLQPYTTTVSIVSTGAASGTTYSGSALSQITVIVPVGTSSTLTLSGTDLSGATIVLPGSSTTTSFVTTVTLHPTTDSSSGSGSGSGSAIAQSKTSGTTNSPSSSSSKSSPSSTSGNAAGTSSSASSSQSSSSSSSAATISVPHLTMPLAFALIAAIVVGMQ